MNDVVVMELFRTKLIAELKPDAVQDVDFLEERKNQTSRSLSDVLRDLRRDGRLLRRRPKFRRTRARQNSSAGPPQNHALAMTCSSRR